MLCGKHWGLTELLVDRLLLLLHRSVHRAAALRRGWLCGLSAANRPPDVILGRRWAHNPDCSWPAAAVCAARASAALPVLLCALAASHQPTSALPYTPRPAGTGGRHAPPGFLQSRPCCPRSSADAVQALRGGLFVFFCLTLPALPRPWPGGTCRARGKRALSPARTPRRSSSLALCPNRHWRPVSLGARYITDLLLPCSCGFWCRGRRTARPRPVGFLLGGRALSAIEASAAFWYTFATESAIFAVAISPPDAGRRGTGNAPVVAALRQGVLAPASCDRECAAISTALGRAAARPVCGHRRPGGRAPRLGAGRPRQRPGIWPSSVDGWRRRLSIPSRTASDVLATLHGEPLGCAPSRHGRPSLPRAPSDRLFAWASEKGEDIT